MARFAEFGSNLYTGKTSIPFVPKRRLWLSLAAALVVISVLIPVFGGGLKFGIDFRGGSEFTPRPSTPRSPTSPRAPSGSRRTSWMTPRPSP